MDTNFIISVVVNVRDALEKVVGETDDFEKKSAAEKAVLLLTALADTLTIDSKEIKNAAKTAWSPDAAYPQNFNEAAEEIEKAREKVLNLWEGTSFDASEVMYLGIQHALTESGGNGPEDRGEFQRFESLSEELNAFVDDIEYALRAPIKFRVQSCR